MRTRSWDVIYPEPGVPLLLTLLGARFRDGRNSYRMTWGELSFGADGWAFALDLFEEHYSLNLRGLWLSLFIRLPFLQRWHRAPVEMMESWGVSCRDGYICFEWGHDRRKSFDLFWRHWVQVAHDVRRIDRSWVPFVGSWEVGRDGKVEDQRHLETFPYRYLLKDGTLQERTATVYVERRIRRLNCFRRLPFGRTSYSISVTFSDEVGERSGSWKGGTIGCGYDLKPGETAAHCLKRMESERKF